LFRGDIPCAAPSKHYRRKTIFLMGSCNYDKKELKSGFCAGQNGCALITARPLRNEDAGAVCHVMKGVGESAESKRLLLEKEHLSAIPSGIALATTETVATADLSGHSPKGDDG